jgi:hypothetical protein
MARLTYWPFLAALSLVAAALPARAGIWGDDDDLKSVMADCNRPDLAADTIDSCLERARVLNETSPSPQLPSLTARLERRAEALRDGTAPSASPQQRAAPIADQSSDAAAGRNEAEARPVEIEGDDPPIPVEKSAGPSDPAAAARDVPPPEMGGPDNAVPPVEDDSGNDPGPPDEPRT